MRNKVFQSLSPAERRDRLERIIRTRTGDVLQREELTRILCNVDVDAQYSVCVVSDPTAFEDAITLKQVHVFLNGRAKSTMTSGEALLGEFAFGESVLKTDAMKRSSGKVKKAVLLDSEKPAAALIETKNIGYDDLSVLLNNKEIVIYVPPEAVRQAG